MGSALLTVAVLAGGLGAYATLRPGGDTYTVTADVEQAPNLFAGGRVMVRGVKVGAISEVEPRPEGVRLTLEIDPDVRLPADATLSVIPVTVISDRYVQVFPAYEGGSTLEDGDHIPVDRTTIPAELEEVLTQLQGLLEALEPASDQEKGSLTRLVESLDEVFANRSEELAGTLVGSAEVLGNLAESRSDIVSLIRNLDRLFASLANRSSQIGIVNERFELVMEALLSDQEHLEGTIENIRFLAGETADLIDSSGDELGESLGRLSKVLRTILRHQGTVAEGLKWGNVIAQATGATDGSGKGLFAYSGRQGAVGSDRARYNYRIDTRDVIGCGRINALVAFFVQLNPNLQVDQARESILTFIPDEIDPHIAFLIDELITFCADRFKPAALTPKQSEQLRRLSEEVGDERLFELLGRWVVQGKGLTP